MARTPEGKVKDAVVKVLKEEDVYYFFPMTHGMGRSGVPDIIACVDGRFVGIECKTDGGRTTELLQKELDDIRKHGGMGMVAYGVEGGRATVRLLIQTLRNKI